MKENRIKYNLPVINSEQYHQDPLRYELRNGNVEGAPLCPFGNQYNWIGFDKKTNSYIRLTKSVFKVIMQEKDQT